MMPDDSKGSSGRKANRKLPGGAVVLESPIESNGDRCGQESKEEGP
jgi:hypothetical protein